MTTEATAGLATTAPGRGAVPAQLSAWTAVALLVSTAGVCLSAYMNVDPDLFWHRVLGAHWVAERGFDLSPDPIAFTPGRAWFPTAWATEVLYAGIVGAVGYGGIFALRFVLAVAFYAFLARAVLRQRDPLVGVAVFTAVALPASLVLQDRPQTFSMVLVAALLPAFARALDDDVIPRWWVIALVTWVWANVHGLWVLVPGLLMLLTVMRLAERRPAWRQSAIAVAVALCAAALTPVGPRLLLAPFLVGRSAGAIAEWRPTNLVSALAWGLAAVLAGVLVAWGRTGAGSGRRIAFVVAIAAFGFSAFREAVVASLLLAPLAASALQEAFPDFKSRITVPRPALGILAVPLALVAVLTFVEHTGFPDRMPVRVTDRIAALPGTGTLRVVAPYDTTGFVREFGGDRVRLSLDGRSDRYGNARIQQADDLQSGRHGWHQSLVRLDPDLVVTSVKGPLVDLLPPLGWTQVMVGDRYVLFTRP